MSGIVIKGDRNRFRDVPEEIETAPFVDVTVTQNDQTTVDLSAQGTIDWLCFTAQTASVIPFDMSYNNFHMKRYGSGQLWHGFSWRRAQNGSITSGNGSQGRTLVCTAADNLCDTALNQGNASGWQTTTANALVGTGFFLSLPTSSITRRLKIYSIASQVDLQLVARVIGVRGQSEVVSSPVDVITGVGSGAHPIWQIDYRGPSRGGRLVVDTYVQTQHVASTPYHRVQGFALQVAP